MYGAVWFADPSVTLPTIRERLRPAGRWDYEPGGWERLLKEHGCTVVRATVLDAPPGKRKVGTLIVQARA